MFLLFGLRSRDRLISNHTGTCEFCGVTAVQSLVKRSTKFTLFFVPLFPVRPSRYFQECGNCRAYRQVDRGVVAHVG